MSVTGASALPMLRSGRVCVQAVAGSIAMPARPRETIRLLVICKTSSLIPTDPENDELREQSMAHPSQRPGASDYAFIFGIRCHQRARRRARRLYRRASSRSQPTDGGPRGSKLAVAVGMLGKAVRSGNSNAATLR